MKNSLKKRFLALSVLSVLALGATTAHAKLNVVTTVPDLAAIAQEVGGGDASVSAIVKGTQDPHYVEAKPSFMTKMSRADLLISIGLQLEIGYLPPILEGARNPKVMPGNPGNLQVGPLVQPLEVPTGKISRSQGDVHPLGNPHVWLDPIRAGQIAVAIGQRMGELDPDHAGDYTKRAAALQKRLEDKTKLWQARIEKSGVKKIVTYHKTLTYFFDRFKLSNAAILEPKPGIPPTATHTLQVIHQIKDEHIPLVMIENYYDSSIGQKIKGEVPSVRVVTVPVSVGGAPGINTIDELYERLVSAVEGK